MTTATRKQTPSAERPGLGHYLMFLAFGTFFGFVLVRSEVVSWYRIQEMFRFQSFHMYGVIGSAVLVGIVSLWLIRRFNLRARDGSPIEVPPKEPARYRYLVGGTLFGLGWALTGACPGPIAALIGAGYEAMLVVLVSAVVGTWVYGRIQHKLPH